MKLIFAGTPQFAASALTALLSEKHEILAVLTQPDRPAGRGLQMMASPVKQLAVQQGLSVMQPHTLKDPLIQEQLAALQADLMVVAAYGLLLPKAVLEIPHHGCFNIHASLLPRWRGAAPIQRALLAGDVETGITIMQMDEGLDTGDMLLKTGCPITVEDTSATLHDKLAVLGAHAIVEALRLAEKNKLCRTAQDAKLATYASKLTKAEAEIDWSRPAEEIGRAIRAYNPYPAAFSEIHGIPVKIWQATVLPEISGPPGTVVHADRSSVWVACGKGGLSLEVLQRPNAKALPIGQFMHGFEIVKGDRFHRRDA